MFSPVSTQSVGFNQPFACHPNSNEEGKEIINQDSNDGEALINQLINYQNEQIQNMDFIFNPLDVSTVGSDVVPQLSSPPWLPGYKCYFFGTFLWLNLHLYIFMYIIMYKRI